MKNKIFVIDYWNYAPHLETSFELIMNHLEKGDLVNYFFIGQVLSPREGLVLNLRSKILSKLLPENRAIRMINNPNFNFQTRINIPKVDWECPDISTEEELLSILYKNVKIGIGVLSSLIHRLQTEEIDYLNHKELIKSFLIQSVELYEYTYTLLKSHNPNSLYLFNGRFYQAYVIHEVAKGLGIEVVFHERGCDNYHYYLSTNSPSDVVAFEDEIMNVWENKTNEEEALLTGENWFISRRFNNRNDWITYSKKENFGLLPKLDFSKRIIVFFTSSNDELFAVKDLVVWDRWKSQEAAVRDLIETCSVIDDVQLVIRIHPNVANKNQSDLRKWIDFLSSYKDIVVVLPNDKVDSYSLMQKASCVVTCGSTTSLEAIFWGIPSICMGPRKYYRFFGKIRPKDNKELNKLLVANLEAPNRKLVLPYGYYLSTYGNKFKYYESTGAFKGKFLGRNLRWDFRFYFFYEFLERSYSKINFYLHKLRIYI